MSEDPTIPDPPGMTRLASARAQAAPLFTTIAPIACALQAVFAVAMFIVSPATLKGWPAQYVIMPLPLWLVAFWLIVWKPELCLLLILIPQHVYAKFTGDIIRVRYLFALKVAVALLLLLALGLRRLAGDRQYVRVRTPIDLPMLAFAAWTAAMMAYGFVRGNPLEGILTSANELLQIPVGYLLLTMVMGNWRRFVDLGVALAALNAPLALYNVLSYGRGGGLYSSLVAIPLLTFVAVTPGGLRHRPIMMAYLVLCAVDVLLCQHRVLWFTTGIAALFLLRHFAKEARNLATVALVFGVAVAIIALAQPGGQTLGFATQRFTQDSGRRGTELNLGLYWWRWESGSPLIGTFGGGTGEPVPWPGGEGWFPVGPWFHNFYLIILFNIGIPGVLIYLWLVLRVMSGRHIRAVPGLPLAKETLLAIATQALYLGWFAGAAFSAPREGHWELGVLPAFIGVLGVLAQQHTGKAPPADVEAKQTGP